MALNATLDLSTPGIVKVTATSDKRVVEVDVTAVGEVAHLSGTFPINFSDAKRTYTKVSDDGVTAVYTAPA